jgi:hypothetical protein
MGRKGLDEFIEALKKMNSYTAKLVQMNATPLPLPSRRPKTLLLHCSPAAVALPTLLCQP